MAVKPTTIALISTAIVATFGIGYLVYYDQQRRSDPNYKKQLKRERKKASKVQKKTQEKELVSVESLVQSILDKVAQETFPESPEEKEAYFMAKVSEGETLCGQGEAYYDDSVEPFYMALKVYPAPLELIMIYQKSLPEKVFRIVVNLMALEQQKRQAEFYQHFPPQETGLKLTQVDVEAEKPVRVLTADKDFVQGDVIYTESPLISALSSDFELAHCNCCMKKLDDETKVECKNCRDVVFCSEACETKAGQQYHQFMCTNNKLEDTENIASKFVDFTKQSKLKYPQMVAQFLCGMVAEEVEKAKLGKAASPYGAWDHIERFSSATVEATEETSKEIALISELLATKVPGIADFLTEEIYLLLKAKLAHNSFGVLTAEPAVEEEKSTIEPARILYSEQKNVGIAIYKISSYVVKCAPEESNVSISFKDNNNVVTVVATKDIKKGDQVQTFYDI